MPNRTESRGKTQSGKRSWLIGDDYGSAAELEAGFRLTDYALWGDRECFAFEARLIAANAVS